MTPTVSVFRILHGWSNGYLVAGIGSSRWSWPRCWCGMKHQTFHLHCGGKQTHIHCHKYCLCRADHRADQHHADGLKPPSRKMDSSSSTKEYEKLRSVWNTVNTTTFAWEQQKNVVLVKEIRSSCAPELCVGMSWSVYQHPAQSLPQRTHVPGFSTERHGLCQNSLPNPWLLKT